MNVPRGDGEEVYLPARMLNEFVYCPRLFYYEHVEGLFAHNRETIEGGIQHRRVDKEGDELPPAEELVERSEGKPVKMRSVMLASDTHGLIAKMDLVEAAGEQVTPVDYKRGRPRELDDGSLGAWDADRVQLAAQALILREHGYACDEAVVYYATTRQRVRFAIDDALIRWTLEMLEAARAVSESQRIPPPLEDSPKCPGCSLVGICLPGETRICSGAGRASPETLVQQTLFDVEIPLPGSEVADSERSGEVRRLIPARDDLRPLYLNTQGLSVGKSGQVLRIKERKKVIQDVRINEISQLNLFGNIQLTTQAIQTLCEGEVPIAYFSMGGWFYGLTQGLGLKNIFLRREQFRMADSPRFCLDVSRALVAGKIRNQRTLLQRNHADPPRGALQWMKCLEEDARSAESREQLLGIEGQGARLYFQNFSGMIKVGERAEGVEEQFAGGGEVLADSGNGESGVGEPPRGDRGGNGIRMEGFRFEQRNRRPPRDPVNALLSLAYSILAKDVAIVAASVGLDPYLGFFHQLRFGRASLALDVMEPFRPLIADSAVLSAINTRMVTPGDFVRAGESVALVPEGRKKFFRAYEQRMDTLVTHPMFGYRVNYRRIVEIQTRLLARVLCGEIWRYPVFTTR